MSAKSAETRRIGDPKATTAMECLVEATYPSSLLVVDKETENGD